MDTKHIDMLEERVKSIFEEMLNGDEAHSYEDAYKMSDVYKDMAEIKKLCYEAEYYKYVVDAMHDDDDRYYRGQPRNARGQYKADGRPNKYYDPMIMPEMMSLDMRDRMPRGMHYYDGDEHMTKSSDLDMAIKNYDMYRRNYNDGTPQHNTMKAKELEKVMKEMEKKVDEIKAQGGMSQEEKNVANTLIKRITDKIMM